jgi:hypothetical protein
VAIVDVGGLATRLDVPGLTGCTEVVALAPLDAAPSTSRAAVLCAGDASAPPAERTGAGLAVVELDATDPPRVADTRAAASLFASAAPTRGLVALDGSWVAAVSAGDPTTGRPDVLVAVDLAADAGEILWSEAWTDNLGQALGTGDYAPSTGELWWPSATSGVLRWRQDGGTFTPLANAAPPTCLGVSPRAVRHVPAP